MPSKANAVYISNGGGSGICYEPGVYLLIAACRHDSSIYLLGIASRHPDVAGGGVIVTTISNSIISIDETNEFGTITIKGSDREFIRMIALKIGS